MIFSFVTLAMFAGGWIYAQTAPGIAGVFPNTNIVQSVVIGFAQGTCNDGANTYWANTDAIQQWNSRYRQAGGPTATRGAITNGLPVFGVVHVGDPDYYQGYVYAPLESAVGAPLGTANIDIAIFIATNLSRSAVISVSNYQSEISSICIDPNLSNSTALFTSSWASHAYNDGIYEYSLNNLTNVTFVKALTLTQIIRNIQGIICIGGMLYVIADNGPHGELYQVNPTNGVVAHLVQLNIAGQTEWEGLDYYQGFLVAAEASSGTVNAYDFFGVINTHKIGGSVKDNHNNPIAGVGVMATTTTNGINQIVTVDTDTNGNYSLTLTNGNWSVALNCTNGSDSLGNLGNYVCPNVQSVNLAANDATVNFIVQNCSAFINTSTALPPGEVGVFFTQTLQAVSCNPGYTWTQTGGSLPSGLSLSGDGTISGTPSSPGGVFNFTVQVTDANYSTASQAFSIGISNAVQIATTALPSASVYNMALNASNGQPPYVWSLTPGSVKLPPNLSLKSNGILSGVAPTNGTFSFSVRVEDSLTGIHDQPLTVTLVQPLVISAAGGKILVLWPASATNQVLQTTSDLDPPNWVTVTDAVPGQTFIVNNAAPQQYFRLN